MAKQNIAVQGATMTPNSPAAGTITPTTSPSAKVKAGGSGVYRGVVSVTFSGTYSGNAATGSGSITGSSSKTKADAQLVLREGDQGSITGTYTNPAPPPPTLPFSATFDVDAAGQVKVTTE